MQVILYFVMPITISNPDLESKLARLGERQAVPVKKATMARAILEAAVADLRGGAINKWREDARRFSGDEAPDATAA